MTDDKVRRIPVRRVLRVALAVALIGLLATSGWLWWTGRPQMDTGAIAVARQQAVNFFSLDHRHVDADLDQVLALSTGDFRAEFAAQRDRITKGVTKRDVVVSADVADDAAALEYQHGDHAQVLVAVDATTKAKSGSQTQRYRVRMTLRRIDGEWLVSEISEVG